MKIETIKKRPEFINIAKNGNKWVTKGMVVQALRSRPNEDTIHIGFTATKKTGNAVTRNRIKRRLRALVRELLPQTNELAGYDLVLIGRYTTANRKFNDLRKDLMLAIQKLGIK